jgi:hypothetical protein
MKKLIGKLFGSEKIVDAGISAADKIFFTNEEKADYRLKLLKAYEPFKLAQRLIALLVTSVYLSIHIISASLFVLSIWFDKTLQAADMLYKMNEETLGTPFWIIVAWYFAGGVVSSLNKKS